MRIEQITIEMEGGRIRLEQDDWGMGDQVIGFPVSQWEYIKKSVDEIITEGNHD